MISCTIVVQKSRGGRVLNMKIFLNEKWFIVEWFLMNIFSFLVVFDWNKLKTIIILVRHFITVNNHRQFLILLIYITRTPTLYYVN